MKNILLEGSRQQDMKMETKTSEVLQVVILDHCPETTYKMLKHLKAKEDCQEPTSSNNMKCQSHRTAEVGEDKSRLKVLKSRAGMLMNNSK